MAWGFLAPQLVCCYAVALFPCVQNQTQQHQHTTGQAQAQNQQQAVAQQATSQTSAQTNGTTGATGGTVGGALQHGQEQAPANKKPRIGPSGAPAAVGMLQSEYQVSVTLSESGMQPPVRHGFLTDLSPFCPTGTIVIFHLFKSASSQLLPSYYLVITVPPAWLN